MDIIDHLMEMKRVVYERSGAEPDVVIMHPDTLEQHFPGVKYKPNSVFVCGLTVICQKLWPKDAIMVFHGDALSQGGDWLEAIRDYE